MQSAVDPYIVQLRTRRHATRQRRRQSDPSYRLLAVFAVATTTFTFCLSPSESVRADGDGSLETMEGLFHRKGWIDPEIYRRKAKRTRRNRTRQTRASRSRHSMSDEEPCTASPPSLKADVEQRERKISRTTHRDSKSVRLASLTTMVPSLGLLTGPEISFMGSAPCIKWAASSRCIPGRLHAAINHVARNYGRVRVNSTCRSPRRNRRVGGARHSYHLLGRAADIRVFGNIRAAARYLRRIAGGYKHYGGGRFHIDTGPKRSW